jgi:hypothetical protein
LKLDRVAAPAASLPNRKLRVLANVQFANRQLVDLQYAKPRPLHHHTIDGEAANGERSYCDRANGRGALRKRQSAGDGSGTGLNNDFAPHDDPPIDSVAELAAQCCF